MRSSTIHVGNRYTLHKNGLTGNIAARKIAPQSTIYRIIKNFKERGSIVAKKAPGHPRKTSKCQDRLLKVFQLRDRATSSAELAQEWQQAGVSASARTVRRRLLEQGLVSRRAAKKPLLSRKNIRDRLIFCKRYREWTAEDWGKVIFSDESPFRLFGTSGKQLVRRRRGERYHQSCLIPTVKHPETIHVWGCFSAKGIGSLAVLPKNTAMNKEWYQNVLREQLLPTVQEQFGDQQCLFQHDGAPCHKAKGSSPQAVKMLGQGEELRSLNIPNLRYGIVHPATFCVTFKRKRSSFNCRVEVRKFVQGLGRIQEQRGTGHNCNEPNVG
ncbi:hypothetical protein SRHO_G00070650 [Serrasalmus rhombeus]